MNDWIIPKISEEQQQVWYQQEPQIHHGKNNKSQTQENLENERKMMHHL